MQTERAGSGPVIFSIVATLILAFAVAFGMWGCPQYNVYSQRMAGEAELAQAQYQRQTAVAEANAKKEAAVALAQADVERAKGVAQANQIIGQSLQKNEAYLIWLWIENLKESKDQVIYVPTEGNLPILEANRLAHPLTSPEHP